MSFDLQRDVLDQLNRDYDFKPAKKGYLREGKCPTCSKRELYINADAPWVVRCGRLKNCGFEARVKELYPDLFDNWSERYKKSDDHPNAAADAYLTSSRGFNLARVRGSYTQEWYRDPETKATSATIRFPLPGGSYWERLIDRPHRFGKMKARFAPGASYAGQVWLPPTLTNERLLTLDELWFVEGVFDSSALDHHGLAAASTMSCNNYPATFLRRLAELRPNTRPRLVWALDGDAAGRDYTRRWVQRARKEGWTCEAATIPQASRKKDDWSDLHLADRLSPKDMDEYRYQGSLLIARSAADKARLMYGRTGVATFFYDHDDRLYWFDLDIKAYDKAMQQLLEKDADVAEDERRELALAESCDNVEIANCNPLPLYYQANEVTDESWYYYRVTFPHGGRAVKNTFAGSSLASASEFKKRLLSMAPGAVFTGTSQQLDRIIKQQLYGIKTVETIDYVGYTKEHGTYVMGELAIREGAVFDLNDEDYFEIGRLNIKTLTHSPALTISRDRKSYREEWLQLVWKCFGAKGLVALTFWFGSLFAEQIRAEQKSYPFLELVGEAGAGKSTLIEFLWKLVGRRDYEGFDPSKATLAARARNFAQVANLPVVLIESDRDNGEDAKKKSFDWDELKTAYNGRSVRALGVKNSGNETREPPFRATVVISQNAKVDASEPIMQRICHITVDRSAHTTETRAAALELERMPVDAVSYFFVMVARQEEQVLKTVAEKAPIYELELLAHEAVKTTRIAKNHGQLLALFAALSALIPFTDEQKTAVASEVLAMAIERQSSISADHKVVQTFWERFDYLDEWNGATSSLNHSRNPREIAVNLNHFEERAREHRLDVPALADLKKYLRTSRSRKFIDQKAVNSAIWLHDQTDKARGRTVKCWVFQRGASTE
ncbi:toprim domain-containing protein [Dyella marensis]